MDLVLLMEKSLAWILLHSDFISWIYWGKKVETKVLMQQVSIITLVIVARWFFLSWCHIPHLHWLVCLSRHLVFCQDEINEFYIREYSHYVIYSSVFHLMFKMFWLSLLQGNACMILISLLGSVILYRFLPFKLRAACQMVSFYIDVYSWYQNELQHLVLKLEMLECCLDIKSIQLVTNRKNYK